MIKINYIRTFHTGLFEGEVNKWGYQSLSSTIYGFGCMNFYLNSYIEHHNCHVTKEKPYKYSSFLFYGEKPINHRKDYNRKFEYVFNMTGALQQDDKIKLYKKQIFHLYSCCKRIFQ
jgi:hypothetical protein